MRFKTFLSIGVIFLLSSVLVLAALDLRFTTAISQAPDPANVGDAVTFTVTLISDGAIVNNLKLIGGVDGMQIVEKIFAGIAAGGTRTQNMTWTATGGAHTVWFELDPGHTQGDSNYGNNRIEKAITVGSGSSELPDLTVKAAYEAVNFKEDDTITLHIYVSNTGDTWSSPCKLFLVHTEANIGYASFDVPQVPNGSIWNTNYDWKVDCGAPLMLLVDAQQKVAELNEDNNTWKKTMKCGLYLKDVPDLTTPIPVNKQDPNGPDLTVKIVKIYKDKTDNSGKTAIVEYEIANNGIAASVPCEGEAKRGGAFEKTFLISAIATGQKVSGSYKEEYVCNQQTSIKVDSNNKNIEVDELNNTAKKTIICLHKPEIVNTNINKTL
jgi:subtilase family serine protease